MDNFGKKSTTRQMPASRPSVVNVPPQSQQMKDIPGMANDADDTVGEEVPHEALSQLDLEVKEVRYPNRRRTIRRIIVTAVITVVVAIIGFVAWFGIQLTPVDSDNTNKVAIQVKPGATPDMIAKQLKQSDLIRNELVFLLTARGKGVQNKLQAGTYRISPSESTFNVIDHLVKGAQDSFDITFLPGATVKEHKEVLIKAGYDRREVDDAFDAQYDSLIFASKPKEADLEGYIYGDTYKFTMGVSVKSILERTFNEFYKVINERGLDKAYAKKSLTLHQGITLASIIQREAGGGDERQISQVFFKRIAMGMPLGSDVTYQYIADKTGVARDVNLDSPYNTRRYTGLPPGPIASPGIEALRAVALPAEGEYIYFLSGDDNVTYYGKTLEEHEANIRNHCQKKCQII